MLWPDGAAPALLAKEVRHLVRSKAFWALLLVLSVLVGYGFIQAVSLYAEASRSALKFPEAARGLSPLDGIMVPTFGAYYLCAVLLWPFVAIRLLGSEKESGSIQLSLQLPVSAWTFVGAKAAALAMGWLVALVPGLSALAIWRGLGGHLNFGEAACLLAGHGLFAAAVAGVAFLTAALSDTMATAAIGALAFTLGTWVLDFAGQSAGWLRRLAAASPTLALRGFERGLFGLGAAMELTVLALGATALAALWIAPAPRRVRFRRAAVGVFMIAVVVARSTVVRISRDVTEDRRHSFSTADEQALVRMGAPLRLEVHLSPDDSRWQDLDQNMLAKLRRVMPNLTIVNAEDGAGLSAGAQDKDYGWIFYSYQGKSDKSTSNSEEEILSILHGLAGSHVQAGAASDHPGYPLVAEAGAWAWWFYGALPAAIVAAAWACMA